MHTSAQNMKIPPGSEFQDILILGGGLSAKLCALALNPVMQITAVIAPDINKPICTNPEDLTGKAAHSHIFLPRLLKELGACCPEFLEFMKQEGLEFRPGSRRLSKEDPLYCQRLFSTRWQFDAVLDKAFRQITGLEFRENAVEGIGVYSSSDALLVNSISLRQGGDFEIKPDTLIIDAMGSRSIGMKSLLPSDDDIIDKAGNIAYVTQFFKLGNIDIQKLPDPLIKCAYGFGEAYVTLYNGNDQWFSISIATNATYKDLIKRLRSTEEFIKYASQNPNVKKWLQHASPIGPARIYVNPRNRWTLPAFEKGKMPKNYIAIGDALVTSIPTLGAGCSFSSSHIRTMKDLFLEGSFNHENYSKRIGDEQYDFFKSAVESEPPQGDFVKYQANKNIRTSKRVKNAIKGFFGFDKKKIRGHLKAGSSL